MSKWSRWRWLLQFTGLVLLVWVLSKIDSSAVAQQVAHADWPLVLFSAGLGLPFIWLKSERWRVVLHWTGSNLSSGVAFRLFSIGLLAGLVTPGQLGEFAKALDVPRQGGTLRSGITASVGDRALDFAILLGLSAYYGMLHRYDWSQLNSLSVFLVIIALVALAAAWFWLIAVKVLVGFPSSLRSWRNFLGELVTDLHWSPVILLAAYTLLAYALYSIRLYLLLLALGHSAPVVAFVSSMAVMSLIALLPISVAGVGTRDAALLVLFGEFNISREAAISFSFLVLVLYLFNAVVGAIAWGFHFAGRGKS